MKLSESVEKLLIDVPKPSNWVSDEYDVGLRDIMVDWHEADQADVDILEIAPSLDCGGVTSIMGVALILHYIGATKVRLQNQREKP